MSKTTPEPWTVGGDLEHGLWIEGPDKNLPVICDLCPRDDATEGMERFTEEDEANAHLLATAPRLAALLLEWRRTPFFQYLGDWQQWVSEFGPRVDAALKAALGEEEE